MSSLARSLNCKLAILESRLPFLHIVYKKIKDSCRRSLASTPLTPSARDGGCFGSQGAGGGFISLFFSSLPLLQAKKEILSILSILSKPSTPCEWKNQGTPLRKRRHVAQTNRHNPLPLQPKRPHDTRDKPGDKTCLHLAEGRRRQSYGGGARRLQNTPPPVLPRPGPGRISLPSPLPPPPEAASPSTRLRLPAFPAPPLHPALACFPLRPRRTRHPPASSARQGRGGKPGHPRRKRRLSAPDTPVAPAFPGASAGVRGGTEADAPPVRLCTPPSLSLLPPPPEAGAP